MRRFHDPKLDYEAAKITEKTLTIKDVALWVTRSDSHPGRLRFFADRTPTSYFETAVKPLLSIKTTGSISVERVGKPLKNKVVEKGRNRTSTVKRAVLLRCGLKLRLQKESLRRAVKAALGKVVVDLDLDDLLVYE